MNKYIFQDENWKQNLNKLTKKELIERILELEDEILQLQEEI